MLIRKKKINKTTKGETPKPSPYTADRGSGWTPGVTDGSWLWPDSAHTRYETGTDGITRPVRADQPYLASILSASVSRSSVNSDP